MSTGIVRSCLCSFLTDSCYPVTERSKEAKQQVKEFIEAVTIESNQLVFDDFASKMIQAMERCFSSCSSTCRSKSVKREKIWTAFHRMRMTELAQTWLDLFEHGFPKLPSLAYQTINRMLFSDYLKCHLDLASTTNTVNLDLSVDEENILRYAAGFVPFKLLKKYEDKCSNSSDLSIIECLSSMAVNGEESDFLSYTTKWSLLIDRGGLFEINDSTFMFFKAIEVEVRTKLIAKFEGSDLGRNELIAEVASDDTVQFLWTIVSIDITDEEAAVKLLADVIGLWVTIRGFSIAGAWMEQYVRASKVAISKAKALRKELKKKETCTSNNLSQ